MFFHHRNQPDEFVSEMPATEYEEDEEYYDEDEEEGEDYEDEEAAPAGRVNVVRNAMFAVAAVIALAAGAYVLAVNFMPDTVNGLINNLPFVSHTDQTQTANAPAAGGEVAPPPGGDQANVPPAPHHHPHHAMPANASGAVAPKGNDVARAGEATGAVAAKPTEPMPHHKAMPKPEPKPVAKPAAPKPMPKPVAKPAAKPVAKPHVLAKHPVAVSRWAARRWAARAYARRYGYYHRPVYRHYYARPVYRRPAPVAPRYGHFAVQVGSFSNSANAAALAGQLRAKGIPAYVSGAGTTYSGSGYMVRSVAVRSRASANTLLAQYRRAGYPAHLINVGGGEMAVAAGVYPSHAAAQAAIARLNARGLFGLIHATGGSVPVSHGLARVWIGGYSNRAAALGELHRLQAQGVPAAIVSY